MKSESKKVVVVGSGGRLGSSLVERLEKSCEVIGFDRKQLDLGCERSIADALEPLEYDHLFLTGALTAVDYCETHEEEAYAVNAAGPGSVAAISAGKNAHVTYISTDMVFDGAKDGLYEEADTPNPNCVYAVSKYEGELKVMEASPVNLVARVSWVYGPGRPAFPEWIIGRACEESHLTLPKDKICCSTHTIDLISWLEDLVFGLSSGSASGVYHLCNSGACTWRDWGQFCIDAAREAGFPVKADQIEGVPLDSVAAFVAKRSPNSAMSTRKYTQATGKTPRKWTTALREFVMQSESFQKYR